MLEYIWLHNYGKGSSVSKASLEKPTTLFCMSSPDHARCPPTVASEDRNQECDLQDNSVDCEVEMKGSKLSTSDEVILVDVSFACPPATTTPRSAHVFPLPGSLSTSKIYSLPVVHAQGLRAVNQTTITTRLCVCLHIDKVAGCRSQTEFRGDAGTVIWKDSSVRRLEEL